MPLQLARSEIALSDLPNRQSEFQLGQTDKIDVTAIGADIKVELLADGAWQQPIRVRAGVHRSFSGLTIAFTRGADGFRLSNWTPGVNAIADVEAYSVGG